MATLGKIDPRGSFVDTFHTTTTSKDSHQQINRDNLRALCNELRCAIAPVEKPKEKSHVEANKILELFDEINFDDKSEWASDYIDPKKIAIEGRNDCISKVSARENLSRVIDSLKKNIMLPGASKNGPERRAEYDTVLELFGHLCANLSKIPTGLVYKKEGQGKISRIPISGSTMDERAKQMAMIKQRNQIILNVVSSCSSSFGLMALKLSQAVLRKFSSCQEQIEGKLIDLRYEILRDQASYKDLITECGKQGIDPLLLLLQHLEPRGVLNPLDKKFEAPFLTGATALKNFDEMYTPEHIVECVKNWIDIHEIDIESVIEWFNNNMPEGLNQQNVLEKCFELIDDVQYIRLEAALYMLKKMGILV